MAVLLPRLWCCELLNATVCLYVSSFTLRCLELILGAFNWRAVVGSLLCVCFYTISTLYTNLVYWDSLCGDFMVKYTRTHTRTRTRTHILLVLSFFKFESFIYEPYLPRPKYLRNPPWWRSLEAETYRRWQNYVLIYNTGVRSWWWCVLHYVD
jgi:hypothetical protein